MQFGNPHALWLLLVFPPAMAVFLWWSWRASQRLMTRFIGAKLLPDLIAGVSPIRYKLRAAALILASGSLIVALARPQWGFAWEEVKQRGLDIVVAIDVSKSMLAEDIAPNRLGRAKLAALDLMKQARNDRLGLVAFAGSAFLTCPMTIDDTAFRQSVESLNVNSISQGGTALAEAIKVALTAFKEGDNHKVLVLLTDGEDHDSGALEAARQAASEGLQIFTVGIGSTEGELLRVTDAQGKTDYVRDGGNVIKSRLNEALLQEIAGATEKGFYLPLRGAKTIDSLFEKGLSPLPKAESGEKLVKRFREQYHWPLALGILLLIAEMLLPERKRSAKLPPRVLPRPALATTAAVITLVLGPGARADASPSSALREYKAGQFDRSLQEFERLIQRSPDDPRLRFNAGNAAYRDQKFDEATKQFEKALRAEDLKLQESAYYNRGNALYQLGESQQDPTKRKEAWEQSLKDFASTLKLNPRDADAVNNLEYVKRKLEELKQQQQQQPNKNQNKPDKDQNQDQQQNQPQQDPQRQQDQQKDQQQPQQAQDQQPQQQPEPQKQREQAEQKADQQKDPPKPGKEEEKQDQAASGKQENKPEDDHQPTPSGKPGQMTPEQARQLLDAEKGDEQMLPFEQEGKRGPGEGPIKDW